MPESGASRAAPAGPRGGRRSSPCATFRPGTASRTSCTASTSTSRAGEVVTLLGRNGAGKTTTLKSIMGIVPRRDGSIKFDGARPIAAAVEPHRPARHRLLPGGARHLLEPERRGEPDAAAEGAPRRALGRADLRAVSEPAASAARARARSCRAASSRCSRSAASCAPARGCCCSTSPPKASRR